MQNPYVYYHALEARKRQPCRRPKSRRRAAAALGGCFGSKWPGLGQLCDCGRPLVATAEGRCLACFFVFLCFLELQWWSTENIYESHGRGLETLPRTHSPSQRPYRALEPPGDFFSAFGGAMLQWFIWCVCLSKFYLFLLPFLVCFLCKAGAEALIEIV